VTPILLDTHVVIWLTEESRQLGRSARRLADRALARDAVAVSAISFWETATTPGTEGLLRHHI
jgi:PIN domain nuclease of toxin-antitoxin system